jgi:superfamily II DNA or RNA helicase
MNNTNLPLEIKNTIKKIDSTYDKEKEYAHDYQYRVMKYMTETNTRGILLFLSPGFGKSILTASITEFYRTHEPKRKIVLLMNKSIQDNFKSNIKKYIRNKSYEKNIDEIIEKKYKFVSLNSSNMYTQISNIKKSDLELEFEKNIGNLNNYIQSVNFLENTLIIVDESHNMASAIKNGSMNALKLYRNILKAKNIKLIFLSGTPMTNAPSDLIPIFNMIKGHALFPESVKEFDNLFVGNGIKNKSIFQNRITGLVSYYGNYFFEDQKRENFPTQLPLIIENVEMSYQQLEKYLEFRDIEIKEESNSFGVQSEGFANKENDKISSYRIKSRIASNYLIPFYVKDKNIYNITKEDLLNLDKFSPKFKKIIDNINLNPDKLSVVYSEFVNTGINLLARVLEAKKYVYWHKKDIEVNEFDLDVKKGIPNKTYAIISGDVPQVERTRIIKAFNSKDNISGKNISVLLISKSGAEGITLKNVRSIHIMEPFWNYARIEQIIARVARIGSHSDLPEKDHIIQPILYTSVYPNKFKPVIKEEVRTTDQELLFKSLNNKKIITQFEQALIEASIDCSINKSKLGIPDKRLACHLCIPDDKMLYTDDIKQDIKMNNCKPFVLEELKTKKITIDGNVYNYTKDGHKIKIYNYDDKIGSYIEMNKNNPLYSLITIKLLKF